MQRKNLLVFLIAFGLFAGGLYLLDTLFPPPPKPDKKQEAEKLSPKEARARATGLAAGGLGAHLAWPAAPEKTAGREPPREHAPFWKQLGLADVLLWVAATGQRPPLITLGADAGSSEYHLQAALDPRGASVRRVILNKFQKAGPAGR